MTRTSIRYLTPYRCLSCDASLEADQTIWAEWLVCPVCETPSKLPEPPRRASVVSAGTFYIGPETTPASVDPGRPRLSWIDEISPRRAPEGEAPARPLLPRASTSPRPASPPGLQAPAGQPSVSPSNGTIPPQSPAPTRPSTYGPTAESLAATFARPAHVPGVSRPPVVAATNTGRIFLGLSLCVSTVAFLFKMLDGDTNWATVWGVAALISMALLAKPSIRP